MNKATHVFGALLAIASAQSFATIGFEGTSGTGNPIAISYTETDYNFSSSHMHIVGSPSVCLFGGCTTSSTGQYLSTEAGAIGGSLTLSNSSSTPFSLVSFDGAELFLDGNAASTGGFPNATTISVVGVKADASVVTASFDLGAADAPGFTDTGDFQTFYLPSSFSGLVSATFVGYVCAGLGAFGIDNINVTSVPEPSTVMLFLLGMTSLWFFRKKASKV